MWTVIANFQDAALAAITTVLASLSIWLYPGSASSAVLSNGTHAWAPTVIVLSLDGFKPEYLGSGLAPTLASLAANGTWYSSTSSKEVYENVLAAEYMLPTSPSLTFPNHWSIQTGLQPSGHGIVANDFHQSPNRDGTLKPNSSFYYTDPARSWDSKWWKGTSMWEHLEHHGIVTANLMWPGPPKTKDGTSSTHFQRYEKGWTLRQRLDRITSWLDLPTDARPQFICGMSCPYVTGLSKSDPLFHIPKGYAPDVDTVTHDLGPDPRIPLVASSLRRVDSYIQSLLQSIADRNASSLVNVVVVSDHGMTFTSNDRLVYIDRVLGPHLLQDLVTIDGWPNVGLRFRSERNEAHAFNRLLDERDEWRRRGIDAFDIVNRKQMVERFNWTMTELVEDRTANLWVLPSVGWSITTHEEMQSFDFDYGPKGNHGYDATHPDMHAFFLALGPSVLPRSRPKMPAFRNVEVHNLAMKMLGVQPVQNDGTPGFWNTYIEQSVHQ